MTNTNNTDLTNVISHNEDMSLLNLLDPTFRSLLVGLVCDDILDSKEGSSNFWTYTSEYEALRSLSDLSFTQFNIVAETAWRVCSEV